MNRTSTITASAAALLLLTVGPTYGRTVTDSEATFEEIDAIANQLSDSAFELNAMVLSSPGPESQLNRLTELRDGVNRIGADLRSLEAERSSLQPWEAKALDQIEPRMAKVAENTEQAIKVYNTERIHLWITSYPKNTSTVSKESKQVASIIHDSLKLAKDHEKEELLERKLNEPVPATN